MNPSASTPATQLDLLSHVALAILQAQESIEDHRTCPKDRLHDVEAWRKEVRQDDICYCFNLAEQFLAERRKRLNPASSLNETGGAVSEGV